MKKQIHPPTHSTARPGDAGSILCHRGGAWRGLLLAACCAVVAALPQPARAAVTEAWVHRYSNVLSNSTDQAFKVVSDAANDIIVTGNTEDGVHGQDMLTIKYSGANGSVLWQKRYNSPANSDDFATAMALDSSGNVVVTGYSLNGSNADYYTAKYAAADGALLWERRYNSPENKNDQSRAIVVDGSGNVVVTGSSYNTNFGDSSDSYTAKYAADDGALLWEKRGPGGYVQAMAADGSGNVVVTGYFGYYDYADAYTAKYAAADGALLWEKRSKGPADISDGAWDRTLAVDASGDVVLTGWSGDGSYYTGKYAAADGALLWEKHGPVHNVQALAVDGNGNVLVTGSAAGGGTPTNYHTDYYTAKYAAADGALLWEKRYNGPADDVDEAQAVAVDGSGNVVVTGYSDGTTDGGYYRGSYTAKYAAADGTLLWEKRYNGPAQSYDYARAVAVDGSGNVVVTGSSGGINNGDYSTAKYAATDGALLWEQRYNGLANQHAQAQAIAVDGSGNVVVTGSSANTGLPDYYRATDYYTAKYAAANGALLWEKRYNGPGNGDDYASAVALDGSGNVVVTGYSLNTINSDYYTAKYAAADGTLLWEKRYNGPENYDDFARAVAADGSGNVVVTGYSQNGPPYYYRDYYTAKYAATDGALLWEKRYNGPANSYDYASAVAVDGSGNVVVTGSSYNTNNNDYYTAKYAAADGTLLWERRYNGHGPGPGPANYDEGAFAVAVDGSGNVVVTGYSRGTNNGDYYTAKYASSDGALLWEKRSNGGGQAVAVDGSGNVVVTGYSRGTNNADYYTAKYAAADGALLWERRSNGAVNSDDYASAVAVDDSGNVVVTGSSYSTNVTADYYTAKYASADGALLWEKRYNGPANGQDTPRSLALGPNGMVAITGSSDGNFGSVETGNYATVVYREGLPPVAIERVPIGVHLRFAGVPGLSYKIERASTVTGPWSTIATPSASSASQIDYIDNNAPEDSAFYRVVSP